jgi:hypothetical protein
MHYFFTNKLKEIPYEFHADTDSNKSYRLSKGI